ncbi:MAG: DUF3299 domain-containing protein [Reinekea sp.]|jgi:uncharacterized protein
MKTRIETTLKMVVLLMFFAVAAQAETEVRELQWDDLSPKEFDLYQEQSKIFDEYDIEKLTDGTPEAEEAMKRVKELNDNAPVVAELNDTMIKIPGFAVPFEYQDNVNRFLLVPYFGACIHTPPPPSNQIILIESEKPIPIEKLGDAIYITGTLMVDHSSSDIAVSSYKLKMTDIEPYY